MQLLSRTAIELVVERQGREETREHNIDADEPQRLPRRHGATRCSVRHCSALRILRALPGPRVLRSGEQQCAVNGGGESRQVPLGDRSLRENGAFSGRMRRSPGECADLRENAPISGRMGRSPAALGCLGALSACLAGSSVRCVCGVHGGRRYRHRVCAGKDSSRRGRSAAWLGRILPRRGDWGNDWEMDVPSVGMYFVPYVECQYNKKNTR